MSEALTESVQRLVLMEADLARFLEAESEPTDELPGDHLAELMARLIANQREVIETLITVAEEIAGLKARENGR